MAGLGIQEDVNANGDGELYGGDLASKNLDLASTRHATKGAVRVKDGETLKPQSTAAFILPQTGAGVPSHTAPEGQEYFDTTANVFYKNTSAGSGTTWARVAYFSEIPSVPTAYGSDATNIGDPDPGASANWSRGDHVHGIERGATIGTPAYNSTPYFNTDYHLLGIRANARYRPLQMQSFIDEDFLAGDYGADDIVGRERWQGIQILTGALASLGDPGHPGIAGLSSNAASNAGYHLRLGTSGGAPWALQGDEWWAALVKISVNNSNVRLKAGFGDGTGTGNDTNAIGFEDSGGTVLRGYCRSGGSQNNTASTFSYTGNTWYWLVMVMRTTANIGFYVLDEDGDTVADLGNVTATIPTGNLFPQFRFWATTATTRQLSIDYVGAGGGYTRTFFRKA